jgi:AraC-like DNA-binding protein
MLRHTFSSYEACTPSAARTNALRGFPELQDFSFLGSDRLYLRTTSFQFQGWRISTVASSGHTIELSDESRVYLLMPEQGCITVRHEGRGRTARAGGLLQVDTGTRRTEVSPDYRGAVILIPKAFLAERLVMLALDKGPRTSASRDWTPGRDDDVVLLRHLQFLVRQLHETDAYGASDRLAASALTLLADLTAASGMGCADAWQPPRSAAASRHQVEQAEEFMRTNLCEPISIGDVAAELGISARALQLAFRRHRNTSPLRSLHARRLELLHARLAEPDPGETVTSVCHDCCIGNPGRIARRYREVFGEQPAETLMRARTRPAKPARRT